MKLQQLRYLRAIARHQFNISKASQSLCVSQSAISKQIQLFEHELGLELFKRKGKQIIGMTTVGETILLKAEQALENVNDIQLLAEDKTHRRQSLSIATTHTQARYVLPNIVGRFVKQFPDVSLHIHQGNPIQVAAMLEHGDVDIAIATEALSDASAILAMPCYQWSRSVIVPNGHALSQLNTLSIAELIRYPIITYVQGFTGRYKIDEAFQQYDINPDIVLTAVDADVIKTYVRLGLGVGIIADMAVNPEQDKDLDVLSAKALFGVSTSHIAIKKDKYIKSYVFQFIELFAPHLRLSVVEQALLLSDSHSLSKLFSQFSIPFFQREGGEESNKV